MRSNDWWSIMFFFLLTTGEKNAVMELFDCDDFDSYFDNLVTELENTDAPKFKNKCLTTLYEHMDDFRKMNRLMHSSEVNEK